jgi:hypothetical protein
MWSGIQAVWCYFAGKKINQLDAEDVDEIEKLGQEWSVVFWLDMIVTKSETNFS